VIVPGPQLAADIHINGGLFSKVWMDATTFLTNQDVVSIAGGQAVAVDIDLVAAGELSLVSHGNEVRVCVHVNTCEYVHTYIYMCVFYIQHVVGRLVCVHVHFCIHISYVHTCVCVCVQAQGALLALTVTGETDDAVFGYEGMPGEVEAWSDTQKTP
jgi:hypothetical protein